MPETIEFTAVARSSRTVYNHLRRLPQQIVTSFVDHREVQTSSAREGECADINYVVYLVS